jgi:predicted nucleic acid-binding protein
MSKRPIVCDTTLLLYLGRIDQARLLPALFEAIYTPEPVVAELDMGRFMRRDTIDPRELDWAAIVSVAERDIDALPPNRLGIGERAVIAYVRRTPDCWAGLDDRQARELAEDLGLGVVGAIGVLLRAKRAELISAIRPLLDALQMEGFRMGGDLYREALQLAGED